MSEETNKQAQSDCKHAHTYRIQMSIWDKVGATCQDCGMELCKCPYCFQSLPVGEERTKGKKAFDNFITATES